MRKNYDWVDRTIFLMFAYAHITDWELADSERSLIQSKIDFVLKKIQGDSYQYEPEIVFHNKSLIFFDNKGNILKFNGCSPFQATISPSKT